MADYSFDEDAMMAGIRKYKAGLPAPKVAEQLPASAAGRTYREAMTVARREVLLAALLRHGGSQVKTAAELDIARETLRSLLTQVGLDPAQIKRGLRRKPVGSVRPFPRRAERTA